MKRLEELTAKKNKYKEQFLREMNHYLQMEELKFLLNNQDLMYDRIALKNARLDNKKFQLNGYTSVFLHLTWEIDGRVARTIFVDEPKTKLNEDDYSCTFEFAEYSGYEEIPHLEVDFCAGGFGELEIVEMSKSFVFDKKSDDERLLDFLKMNGIKQTILDNHLFVLWFSSYIEEQDEKWMYESELPESIDNVKGTIYPNIYISINNLNLLVNKRHFVNQIATVGLNEQ